MSKDNDYESKITAKKEQLPLDVEAPQEDLVFCSSAPEAVDKRATEVNKAKKDCGANAKQQKVFRSE